MLLAYLNYTRLTPLQARSPVIHYSRTRFVAQVHVVRFLLPLGMQRANKLLRFAGALGFGSPLCSVRHHSILRDHLPATRSSARGARPRARSAIKYAALRCAMAWFSLRCARRDSDVRI